MLIDGFTVGAQVLNFLILVWLLKRFLYKPILNAIDAREKRIAAELTDADAKKTVATQECDKFEKKNLDFDQQRITLLNQATEEANAERKRLLDEARKDADSLRAKRQDALQREAKDLSAEIMRRTQVEVFAIARCTLGDLAGASLEERMCDVFIDHLSELDQDVRKKLFNPISSSGKPAFIRSRFELPLAQREKIQRSLNETFSANVHVQFETAVDVICGIELTLNGRKIAWSIRDYLASMESCVSELLQTETKPTVEPQAKQLPSVVVERDPSASVGSQ